MGELSATGHICMAALMIPAHDYILAVLLLLVGILYSLLDFHFLRDFFRGFRGDVVNLTFDPRSKVYENVVSKCRILHGRYLATPWLSSPHFQLGFLSLWGRPPTCSYTRQLFSLSDGGSIALDWLFGSDVSGKSVDNDPIISKDDRTPIVIVVPGLTSDSSSNYLKHIAYKMAGHGWNVVVENHRGLGGVSMTSDRFYNASWTEDLREVVGHLHQKYPMAPLFAIGTSIGANILVKYLGEEGEKTPVIGAASVCSTWDLLVCDRFINRKLVQRFYNRALATGLKKFANLHRPILARLANWDGIMKSKSIRDFDNHVTCPLGKFETVDAYYRNSSCASYVRSVSVPLLCISALDDPVCTREAIPWNECRANENIVLATTMHGGHLTYFEGMTARSLWWVRAVAEFLSVLHSVPYLHEQKLQLELSNSMDDVRSDESENEGMADKYSEARAESDTILSSERCARINTVFEISPPYLPCDQKNEEDADAEDLKLTSAALVKGCLKQLSTQSRKSIWLLVYIAIVSSWPVIGSALRIVFRNKLKDVFPRQFIKK